MDPKFFKTKDFIKTRIINSFVVRGKRVLDVGCSDGMYSFYLARNGAEVDGIDLDKARIDRARETNNALEFSSVQFRVSSVYDMLDNDEYARYDLALAWGFLHRIPDPFNVVLGLGSIANVVSLEWRAPAFIFPRGIGGAIHNPSGYFEWKNIDIGSDSELNSMSYRSGPEARLSDFWKISPSVVISLLQRIGFSEFNIDVVKNEVRVKHLAGALSKCVLNTISSRYQPVDWPLSRRVHLLASRESNDGIWPGRIVDEFTPGEWDHRFSR